MTMIIDGTAGVTFPVVAGSASAVQASSGRVLQVVQSSITSTSTTTSTSYVTSGLSVSITPTSSTSKVLVMFAGPTYALNSGGYLGAVAIYNGSTNLISGQAGSPTQGNSIANSSLVYLDSPATTSAVTYALYMKSEGNSSTTGISWSGIVTPNPKATLTVMEISA